LHKSDQSIRPFVNWCSAPSYKLSKFLADKIQHLSPLPCTFNIKNTIELIKELRQTPITPTSVFVSLDITNMYSSIPIGETKFLDDILTYNPVDPQAKTEILSWYEIITKQNYFLNNNEVIIQNDGPVI
jgi:hypothetical protein